MTWPWLLPYLKSSVYSYWLPCIKFKYSEYSFSYAILQYALYQDPGKGNAIAYSVVTTTPIAFIFTRYCLFSMFCKYISMIENLLVKMHIEGALMSQSSNIAFNYTGVTSNLGLSNLCSIQTRRVKDNTTSDCTI